MPRPPGRILVRSLIALLCLIWGSTWIVIRGGLTDLPPFTGAAARFVLAATVVAALAPWLARVEGGTRPTARLSLTMGTLNIALSYALVYWSETILPSGLVAVLWAAHPMMLGALSVWLLPQERLVGRQWLGLLLGFGGIVLLFLTDLAGLGPGAVPAGLLLLGSPFVAAVGNLLIKRDGGGTSSVLLNRNGFAIGGVLLTVLALATEHGRGAAHWSPVALGSVAHLSLVGSVLAFGLYFWLLRHAPAYELGLISYVTPVVALLLGATVGDEPIGWKRLLGTAFVLCGVALVLAGRRRSPRAAAADDREALPGDSP
jgi:drug/metabolite transporter (DMT)-like permease